ncbi:hypothetical protein PoB_000064800 [Plakobranchus ocellatus]|uniref:Sushi domain-containing protein n=1 Tax=Plakobranchus ocellatus TaxID=259542 RepID=A0AAV3XV36_9GAST|nr:hypothetical protein PoB_000064800 [Plakobranchus ocellatus]
MLSSTANEGASLEVTCSLSPGSFTSIGVFRRVGDIEQPIVYFFSNGTESIISQGVTSTIRRLVGSATHMVSVLDQVTCTVAGEYVCKHDNGQQASANITVHVTATAVGIITSEDMIEGQETEISCTGTVDNMGDVILTSQDTISDAFVESTHFTKASTMVNSGDQCKSSLTTQFTSALDLSHNGTNVRCETTSPVSTSRTVEIVIVQESICDGKNEGTAVAHPYSLTKYVICGNSIKVNTCAVSLIWRQDLKTCVDPGAAEVTMLSGTANEGSSLEVTCSLSTGSFTSIGVFRRDGDFEQPIVYFFSNGTESIVSQRVTSTMRRLDGSATHMVSVFDKVTCTVAGEYVCKHDNGQQASANITVYALPSGSSSVEVPRVFIAGSPGTVRCSSMVIDKANKGVSFLERAPSEDGPFTNVGLQPTSSFIKSEDQCETTADLDYTIPDVDFLIWNGSYVKCRTDFPVMTTQAAIVLVIDSSICSQVLEGSNLPNPYEDDSFILCTGGFPQLQYCSDGKIWRQDFLNCAFASDATVSARDKTVEANVNSSVNITCSVTPGTYEYVRLYQDNGGKNLLLATFYSDGSTIKESEKLSDLYRETEVGGSELMTSQLADVICADQGVFWCQHDNTQKDQLELIVNVPPSVVMTPDDDFAPITSNMIVCVANLDLRGSQVNIHLKRRDEISGVFEDANVPVISTDVLDETPGCFQRKRTIFSQVFDLAWNNTDVRCDVPAPESTSDVFTLLVIPGDICVSRSIAEVIAHPYTSFRFIMCFGQQFVVMPCPGDGYRFIPAVKECVIDGTPVAAIEAPARFTDLEDLILTCYVTGGHFDKLELLKIDGDTRTPVVSFGPDFSATRHFSREIDIDTTFVDALNVRHVIITLKTASCKDIGQYTCNLDNGQDRATSIDIYAIPEDIISDATNNITCESREYPGSQFLMGLQRFDSTSNQWQNIAEMQAYQFPVGTESGSQCRMGAHFEQVYDLTWNNTDVRCEVKDTSSTSDFQTLYIIPGDYCEQFPMASTQIHPYNSNKYFYCFAEVISIFTCPDSTFVWSQSEGQCILLSDSVAKSTTQRVYVQTSGNVAPISSISPETTATTTTTVLTTTAQPPSTARPDPEISVIGGNFSLGVSASITCEVSHPMEGSVVMIFMTDIGLELVATFDMDNKDGSQDTAAKTGISLSRSEQGKISSLTATFDPFLCSHVGMYACSDDGGHTGSANAGAIVPEQILIFQPPTTMTTTEEATFDCSGIVDKSGRLYFSIQNLGQPDSDYR